MRLSTSRYPYNGGLGAFLQNCHSFFRSATRREIPFDGPAPRGRGVFGATVKYLSVIVLFSENCVPRQMLRINYVGWDEARTMRLFL